MEAHRQVEVVSPNGTRIQIDEGLSRVLPELWRLGIYTSHSCQGSVERPAYIMFADRESADALYRLIDCRNWTWEVSRESLGRGERRRELRTVVRFPARDIRKIERALEDAAPVRRSLRAAA